MAIEKLESYERPAKVNPYVEDLKGLAVGDVFAVTGKPGERIKVQDGARENGFTVRVQESTENEDGTVRFVFKVFPKQKSSPRGSKPASE